MTTMMNDMSTRSKEDVENYIAQIIAPRTMDGHSKNGNLDVMKVLDRASEILDEVMEWADERVRADIVEAMQTQDMRMIPATGLSDMQEQARAVSEALDEDVQNADSWLLDLDLDRRS